MPYQAGPAVAMDCSLLLFFPFVLMGFPGIEVGGCFPDGGERTGPGHAEAKQGYFGQSFFKEGDPHHFDGPAAMAPGGGFGDGQQPGYIGGFESLYIGQLEDLSIIIRQAFDGFLHCIEQQGVVDLVFEGKGFHPCIAVFFPGGAAMGPGKVVVAGVAGGNIEKGPDIGHVVEVAA